MTFTKILEMCEKHGFLKKVSMYNQDILRVGPIGALLQENLRSEWLYSVTTNRDLTACINSSSFSDSFNHTKELCSQRVPFSLAEIEEEKCRNVAQAFVEAKDGKKEEGVDFKRFFIGENRPILRCTTFVAPAFSTPHFHQWQRQRKAWWRKVSGVILGGALHNEQQFSASPGRYILTDIQSKESDHCVEIQAKYEWGTQLLETITLYTGKHRLLAPEQQIVKDSRKLVQSHFITSNVCFSTMLLNTLCDAYEEPKFQGENRPMFRFHRKLAPYKVAFALSSNVSSIMEQLKQLAQYLAKQLRTKKVATLLLPSAQRDSLEVQWNRFDQMGVPYQVLLNERTLKNGIVQLRSRDTTLKEQVHVSELQGYVVKLFENY